MASASKSSLVNEVSALQTQVKELQGECELKKNEVDSLGRQLALVMEENGRMKEALDVKAEEFGLVGDLRAQLLYEVAEARNLKSCAERSLKPLEADICLLRTQLQGAYTTIAELKLVREANNDELIRLEQNLQAEIDVRTELEVELERALEEKARLLDLVDELNSREAPEIKASTVEKGVNTEGSETIARLEREVKEKEELIRRQTAAHKQEIEEMKATVTGLETALLQAKAGSPPPPVPVSGGTGEVERLSRKTDLPIDPSRFRALIAEERLRTEELMRRYRPQT